jgi:hypothetical protein
MPGLVTGKQHIDHYTWTDEGDCLDERGEPYADMSITLGPRNRLDVEFCWGGADLDDMFSLERCIEALTRLRDQLNAGELPKLKAILTRVD